MYRNSFRCFSILAEVGLKWSVRRPFGNSYSILQSCSSRVLSYSQHAWDLLIRGNPKKTKYSAEFCPFRVDGPQALRSGPCRHGDQCRLSHTNEETQGHGTFRCCESLESGRFCHRNLLESIGQAVASM